MKYKVLLINPDENVLKKELKDLSARSMNIIGASTVEDACRLLREDGLIHAVLTEWEVPVTSDGNLTMKGSELFSEFLMLRTEVNIFLYSSRPNLPYHVTGGELNGYFYKKEHDYDDIVRKVKSEVINSKNRAPFFEKLVEYSKKAKDSWHTPGHASGYSLKNSIWAKALDLKTQ